MPHVVIRGLARITFCEILKDVLDFLTLRGRINFGIMDNIPRDTFLNKQYSKVFRKKLVACESSGGKFCHIVLIEFTGCRKIVYDAEEWN